MDSVKQFKNKRLKRTWSKTPTIFQMEATECGAASLAMILAYYKNYVPLEKLRIDCGVSKDGCNASNVATAAKKHGLDFKAYKYDLEALIESDEPCIIHWKFNHFVVYEGIKNGHPFINDPAEGRRKLSLQELDECFTGIVLTFKKSENFVKNKKNGNIINFIFNRSKNQKKAFWALLILGILLVFPGYFIASSSKIFIDYMLVGKLINGFIPFILVLLLTGVIQFTLIMFRSLIVSRFQMKLSLVFGYEFLSHMLKMPLNFYEQRYAGDLSERITNNDNANGFISGRLVTIVLDALTALLYFFLMISYNVSLTIISVIGLAASLVVCRLLTVKTDDIMLKFTQDNGKLSGILFSGIEISSTLKACGAEDKFVQKVLGHYAGMARNEQKVGRIYQILGLLPSTILSIISIIVIMLGAIYVMNGYMSLGMLTAFGVLFSSFVDPVNQLISLFQEIQTLKANLLRVKDIENYEEDKRFEKEQISEEDVDKKMTGKITINNLKFGYSPVAPPFYEDFSLTIKPGEVIALVGPSGCGKSTILKLLSGLYDPWEGQILYDDKPLCSYPVKVATTSISSIGQEVVMFSGSIKDNLTLWNDYAIETDITHAAKDACIDDVVSSLTNGYSHDITMGAKNLSGGQAQRLEIARALVNNPSILLMDEATSALDPVTETQIMKNIKKRGCTCVIVAHRLSTIRDADKIVCIDNGKIVQSGNHDQLKNVEGLYKELIKNL